MTATDTLDSWGVLRADEIVATARAVGLGVDYAATLLELESGPTASDPRIGRNVWGHDKVDTGGAYVMGAEVTEAAYRAYCALVSTGTIKRQGVGPVQLTARDFQDQADRLGGCWRPELSTRVGFALLAAYLSRYGEHDAYTAYNGGPGAIASHQPDAWAYGDKALVLLAKWRDRLGPTVAAVTPTAAAAADYLEDLDPMSPIPITVGPDGFFRATVMAEAGASSLTVERAWITFGSTWGGSSFRVCALGSDGTILPGGELRLDVADNHRGVIELPDGVVMATLEGHVDKVTTIPAAALVQLPR